MGVPGALRLADRGGADPARPDGSSQCGPLLTALLRPLRPADAQAHAQRLLDDFGSLSAVLAASPRALARACDDAGVIAQLSAVRPAMLHSLKSDITGRTVLSSGPALIDYLNASLAHATEEQLRVLFLNARNELLRDELAFDGSVATVRVLARPIIKRALELGATAVILVHNHPSGDPTPSCDDIRATANFAAAARPLDISVHDHIIVGRSAWTSLKSSGLLAAAA